MDDKAGIAGPEFPDPRGGWRTSHRRQHLRHRRHHPGHRPLSPV